MPYGIFYTGYTTFAASLNSLLLTVLVVIHCKNRRRRGAASLGNKTRCQCFRFGRRKPPPNLPVRDWLNYKRETANATSTQHSPSPCQSPPPPPPPPPPAVKSALGVETAVKSPVVPEQAVSMLLHPLSDPKLRMPAVFMSELISKQQKFAQKKAEEKFAQEIPRPTHAPPPPPDSHFTKSPLPIDNHIYQDPVDSVLNQHRCVTDYERE